jgi:hypothetical protein
LRMRAPEGTPSVTSHRDFWWRHFRLCMRARSLPVAPPHRSTRNATFSVLIYYCLKIRKRYSESVNLYQDMCVFRHRRSQWTLYWI